MISTMTEGHTLPYRVGTKIPRNVYERDVPLFVAATPELAARIVRVLNKGAEAAVLDAGVREALPGWKLVPKEPTREMMRAADEMRDKQKGYLGCITASLYRSMLAASPVPPALASHPTTGQQTVAGGVREALAQAITDIHAHISTPEGMKVWNRLNDLDITLSAPGSAGPGDRHPNVERVISATASALDMDVIRQSDGLLVGDLRALWSEATSPPTQEPGTGDTGEIAEALRFYANPKNWIDTPSWDGDPTCITEKAIPVDRSQEGSPLDCGDRARKALAAYATPATTAETQKD